MSKPKKTESDEYEDIHIEIGRDDQFGRIVKTVRRRKQEPTHCCDWTGPETCPGCRYNREKRASI